MRFFFDNCLSDHLARAIEILERNHEIVHLRAKFVPDVDDVTWISALGSEGDWVIVSGDQRISRSKEERRAWHESGLTAFFFGKGYASKGFWRQVQIFVQWWPKITQEAREYQDGSPGSGYLIPAQGKKWSVILTP